MLQDQLKNCATPEEKESIVLEEIKRMGERSDFGGIANLIINLKNSWEDISTARLTKIVKKMFSNNYIAISVDNQEELIKMLRTLILWAEDRKLVRLDLQCKLIHVLLSVRKYSECLEKIGEVIQELKRYDDKVNMISLFIYESKAYYELKDLPRSKAALTSARALAVSSATPSGVQAQIDILTGIYMSDEGSYEPAISYFIEAVQGFLQDHMQSNAGIALRYIILNKIMSGRNEEVNSVLEAKYASTLKNDEYINLLVEMNKPCKEKDLYGYRELIERNLETIRSDPYVLRHLERHYDILLEMNIVKIIEPYSHVKIKYIADQLNISEDIIENKLRKMILDRSINGILDHILRCLILYEDVCRDTTTKDEIVLMKNFLTFE